MIKDMQIKKGVVVLSKILSKQFQKQKKISNKSYEIRSYPLTLHRYM